MRRFTLLFLFVAMAGCTTTRDGKKHHYLLENKRSLEFLKDTMRENRLHGKSELRNGLAFKKFNRGNLREQREGRKFLKEALLDSEWSNTKLALRGIGNELKGKDNSVRDSFVWTLSDD